MRPSQREHAGSMDVVQGTFLVALGKLADFEFETPSALLRYLGCILDNQLRDISRRSSERPRAVALANDVDSSDGHAIQPVGREPQPLETLSEQEFLEIRAAVVALLEPEARDVLLMREVGGASWEEIAEELGSPTAHAAEQRYQRARNRRDVLLLRRVRF
jgi:RNA polymerase sigma factor (sigma-70 family)